jgi:uncharacterized membrane protein
MNRRQFTWRGILTFLVLGFAGSAFKCDSDKVSIYVLTITNFLKQISSIMPQWAATITKILAVATDFDAAYKHGDFSSADNLFNTLDENILTLTKDLGVNLSDHVKMLLAVIGATVQTVAVLLHEQIMKQPASAIAAARAAKSSNAVERLSAPAAVNATFETAKLKP